MYFSTKNYLKSNYYHIFKHFNQNKGMGQRLAQVNKGQRWSVDQPVVVGRNFYT